MELIIKYTAIYGTNDAIAANEESIADKNTNCIDLYHNLTYLFLTDSTPLLFIVDHFNHLSQNMNWFQIRNNPDDIIIDYHGNCIRPYYWFIK